MVVQISHFTGPAHYSKTDSDGTSDWKRAVWRGVARPLERRKSGSESVFHPRGGQLVQRDGDLPNCADETREHTG